MARCWKRGRAPKSFRVKDASGEPPGPGRNTERDFHGERRKNETHASTTDPDARFFCKGPGKEERLCFLGHALMENCNGLIVGAVTTRALGHAAGRAALALIEPHADRPQPVTLGADKSYDTSDFLMELRDKAVTRMWHKTRAGVVRRSMATPSAIPAMPSPSAFANAWKKPSAGPGQWPGCARGVTADCPRSAGNSHSPWLPITSPACQSCSSSLVMTSRPHWTNGRCCPRHLSRAGGWSPQLPGLNGYRASTQAAAESATFQ